MKYSRFEDAGYSVPASGLGVLYENGGTGDGFELNVSKDGVTVFCGNPRAKRFAQTALKELLAAETVAAGRYFYSPAYKIRGLLEGFYGPPWNMAERRRALSLLSARGMNVYFYGPKDDPFHRDRWDEPYSGDAADTLKAMLALSGEFDMDFRYMLAPGLSIRYSSDEDMRKLEKKYEQVYSFGVRGFALLLDDLSEATVYEEDSAIFPRQVDAHIALVNRMYTFIKKLDPANVFCVCPTQYWGDPGWDYVKSLGRALPDDALLFFTGEKICSRRITSEQAEDFLRETGHMPLYWDNYPVNDMEMTDELHLSPYKGRDGALGSLCEGVVANPMEFAEASLIPLMTVADCLWDGDSYMPDASFLGAAAEVLGAGFEDSAALFAELCYKSCLEGHYFQYRYLTDKGYNPVFAAALEEGRDAAFAYVAGAAEALKKLKTCKNAKFLAECGRWLASASEFCTAALELRDTGKKDRLTAYLSAKEDIMKREAELLLECAGN